MIDDQPKTTTEEETQKKSRTPAMGRLQCGHKGRESW
jgi:hypothetical protein